MVREGRDSSEESRQVRASNRYHPKSSGPMIENEAQIVAETGRGQRGLDQIGAITCISHAVPRESCIPVTMCRSNRFRLLRLIVNHTDDEFRLLSKGLRAVAFQN